MPQPPLTVNFRLFVHPELLPSGDVAPLLMLLSDLSPVLEEMGEEISREIWSNFDSRGATFGEPWQPNKPATDAAKARKGLGTQQMVEHGRLMSSLATDLWLTPDSVTTGVDLSAFPKPYPAYHQAGSPETGLPQRILVAVTPDMVAKLLAILEKWIGSVMSAAPGAVEIEATYA